MGCLLSREKPPIDSRKTNTLEIEIQSHNNGMGDPEFTEVQKQLVKTTWDVVRDDISKVGVITFLRLFEKCPDVQDLFVPFRGLTSEELRHNVGLREHGLRVMGTIEKCITRLDKPEKLIAMLETLGEKHIMFDTKAEYFDLLSPQLIQAIKPAIGDQWTPAVEQAWINFLLYITGIMKNAMLQAT
ncbi:uncharacterized protein LOC125652250 [Ostrea edulis]|uniref:uncharacterized protein LOC125652250 n=1 Tax=Ostrea edulis TaxID=37623 RepID=UPI00209507A2|nr:uncharacterized protein LOC125652250 [Ostrea edulis]